VSMPARVRRQSAAAQISERPLLVFDFHGRPLGTNARAQADTHPPQSIREAVLAWLDEQL
jgi:hypothetical protein